MFLTDLWDFFLQFSQKVLVSIFLLEDTEEKRCCWQCHAKLYTEMLNIQCSNNPHVGIGEGWEADGSLAVQAVRAGVPQCFWSCSVEPSMLSVALGQGSKRMMEQLRPWMGQLTSH